MPYLKLFHGRDHPGRPLEEWGLPGPIFGPFPWFHTTCGSDIAFDGGEGRLTIVGDEVYYDRMFYGDWSVFEGPPEDEDRLRLVAFDAGKAEVPDELQPCACSQPGHFHCGVPGVIAHLENGRLPPHGQVERCDQCGRYPDDEAARQQLIDRGLVWTPGENVGRYAVVCQATVRVPFSGITASTPQDAARIADALFDWDKHQSLAEYAGERTEYLVTPDGPPDTGAGADGKGKPSAEPRYRFNADCDAVTE